MTTEDFLATQETNTTNPVDDKKRKREDVSPVEPSKRSADAYSRLACNNNNNNTTSQTGRGSQAGWTHCPLCYPMSRKLFAQGRGVASHLHAVHTPWKEPSKAERKRRRQAAQRRERQPKGEVELGAKKEENPTSSWEPTPDEVDQWNAKVLQMVQELEVEPLLSEHAPTTMKGVDRTGKSFEKYRSSLPPFLQAAADGDLVQLRAIVNSKTNDQEVLEELNRTDRHLSIAEHWAAGGGHLECLKFLLETRKRMTNPRSSNSSDSQQKTREKVRRRDGKTALHYAARNGRVQCIEYLIQEHGHDVDEVSGDGSTPLHLACYGGHFDAMKLLIDTHGANAKRSNEWDCNSAHWIGMTKCESTEQVRSMCRLLQAEGVCFISRQKQGHTVAHKAAQRKNKHVIEWLTQSTSEGGAGLSDEDKRKLGAPDEGGHTPSAIWLSVGGDPKFGEWMKTTIGW